MSVSQSLSSPAGMLTSLNTFLIGGGIIWGYRTKTELQTQIQVLNRTIIRITEYIHQIDPKSAPRLQHFLEELQNNVETLTTTLQEMTEKLEHQESKNEVLESNIEKIVQYLRDKDPEIQLQLETYVTPIQKSNKKPKVSFVQRPISEPSSEDDTDEIEAIARLASKS